MMRYSSPPVLRLFQNHQKLVLKRGGLKMGGRVGACINIFCYDLFKNCLNLSITWHLTSSMFDKRKEHLKMNEEWMQYICFLIKTKSLLNNDFVLPHSTTEVYWFWTNITLFGSKLIEIIHVYHLINGILQQ